MATSAAAVGTPRKTSASNAAATEGRPAVRWEKAPCRLCGVGCGLLIGIENGRAVAAKGDPDSPVSKGLACAKGYYAIQALYGRDRLRRAIVRRDGATAEVPIGEALDVVAAQLRDTIRAHGPESVAIYGSAQWSVIEAYVASKLFKGGLGSNNVETSSRLYAAAAMAGRESTFGLDAPVGRYEDIDHADVIVLWDANVAETDPVLFSRMLERRRLDPAVRIVDIATRTTRTSAAADQSLLHAPHATIAIANAICQEIVERRYVDRDFVTRHVAFKRGRSGIGHDAADVLLADDATDVTWTDYVDFLAAMPPTRAAELSGMRPDRIRWLASLYGDRTKRVTSIWGADVSRHSRGTWTNNALYNIHLLVGKVATPGNAALCLTGQPSGTSAVHTAGASADALPRGTVRSEADRRRAAAVWGVPAQRIATKPGLHAQAMFRALDRGEIRFLWIQGTNPMVSLPSLDRYRRAAAKQGRFIVVSEVYPTPTTDIADVVLPAALWMEREGVFGNQEGRLQHFTQMVAPPGDAMSDAWQLIEVARRLGLATLFPSNRGAHVADLWEEYRRFHDDASTALPSIRTLRARPGVLWPFVDGREATRRYHSTSDPGTRGAYDFPGHGDRRAWIWLRAHESPAESPGPDYPFWLRTGAVLEHWGAGSMTRRIPSLHRSAPAAYVEIHREDASRLGIHNFERVRLVSRRAALEIEARIDYRSQPALGTVFVPSFDDTVPINRLMTDAACPLSGQPDAMTCAVRIERLTGRAGA